jgi:uncharacterized protein (TIGR00730 family)
MKKIIVMTLIFGGLLAQISNANDHETLMSPTSRKVCVFCSADDKIDSSFKDEAFRLGQELAKISAVLITGGAKTGLMKSVTDGFTSINKEAVYGVMPLVLKDYRVEHPAIPSHQIHWMPDMYERLKEFHRLSDTCIVLPGGWGTLHELMDFLVSDQFAIHKTTIILVNFKGYWDHLLLQFGKMWDENALAEKHLKSLKVASGVEDVIYKLTRSKKEAKTHNGLDDRFWENKEIS